MAFNRPTLQTILQRLQADINSRLTGSDSYITRAVLYVIARAIAGVAHGLYGHQSYTAQQIIPDTADSDNLERQAFWLGRGMTRNSATAATGPVTFTGTDGSVIPAGTKLQRSDGIEYTTDSDGTIVGSSIDISVTATSTGQDTNASAGQVLNLVSPVNGVQGSATVAEGGVTGGSDTESDAQLLARLREFVAASSNGVNLTQYAIWAKKISGVTRAWPFEHWLGIGTVGLAFVRDDDASIIPDAAEVQNVQDYIDERRPPGMTFVAFAPTAVPQDLTIQLSPNTATVQAAVQAELDDLFRREAQVEDGTGSGTILLSRIDEAVSIADGELDHVLVTPVANITLNPGELASLGTITWQALP